jgi:putative molybdopterin biosynthesis protein
MTQVLRNLREKHGLTQAALADAVGLSRQSLNAIEAGRSVPSVAIALKLARTLEASVETLFAEEVSEQVQAELSGSAGAGARVVLGWLRERWVAHASFGVRGAADGFLRPTPRRANRVTVELSRTALDAKQSVLVAGCAPGLAILADRLNGDHRPGRFCWLTRSNTAALRDLAASHVHLAGIHVPKRDPAAIARSVARHLPTARAEIYALSSWEAGLVVAKGQSATHPQRGRSCRSKNTRRTA